jgi:hypothetical protein
MLPFCQHLTLWERSIRNVAWLRHQNAAYAPSWDLFWERMAVESSFTGIENPRSRFAERSKVKVRSVFELPPHAWDIGTMFFVAESISPAIVDFEDSIKHFLRALRTGAPFAMTFMESSQGYVVGECAWPAVGVTAGDIGRFLAPLTSDLTIKALPTGDNPLRDGYTGMVVACGHAK